MNFQFVTFRDAWQALVQSCSNRGIPVHPEPSGVNEFDTRRDKDHLASLIHSRKEAVKSWGPGVMPVIIVAMPDNRWIYRLFFLYFIMARE